MPETHRPSNSPDRPLPPEVADLLRSLRSRIRRTIVSEALTAALLVLLLAGGLTLAMDYLPIRGWGAADSSWQLRGLCLLVSLGVALFLLYRLGWRRYRVPLPDPSLALLVERRYPEFQDSLLTVVATAPQPATSTAQQLWEQTVEEARRVLPQVDLGQILSLARLRRLRLTTGLLLAIAGVGVIGSPSGAWLAVQRIYGLSNATWPRRFQIELAEMRLAELPEAAALAGISPVLQPQSGAYHVMRGASLNASLVVRGTADQPDSSLPDQCWAIYRLANGIRGRQPLTRIGQPQNGVQAFELRQAPIANLTQDVSLEILAGDDRLGPIQIRVVDPPAIRQTSLAVRYPDYLARDGSLRFTPRVVPWTGQQALPRGAEVEFQWQATQPLAGAVLLDNSGQIAARLDLTGSDFSWRGGILNAPWDLQLVLVDAAGVFSREAQTLRIDLVEDQPPVVETRLRGIGTAVTATAQIPITGNVSDDYGVASNGLELQFGDEPPQTLETHAAADGEIDWALDLRDLPGLRINPESLAPGSAAGASKLQLTWLATDHFDLEGGPHEGRGDRFELDIVSEDELLRLLEQQEVGQRRRLEQVLRELGDLRRYLTRTLAEPAAEDSGIREPDDPTPLETDVTAAATLEVRQLFSQRSAFQTEKSQQELLGCAEAFAELRLQLINNRIAGTDRLDRYQTQIIEPLEAVAENRLGSLRQMLVELQPLLTEASVQAEAAASLSNSSLEQCDQAREELNVIINRLVKYETQNELLDVVRQLLEQQRSLREATEKARQRRAFEGLLDLGR